MKPLEPQEITSFLAETLGDEVTGLEPLHGGEWSQAFGFTCLGKSLVARFGDYADDFEKDRTAAQFNSPNLPVPAVLKVGLSFGGHFCISERAYGVMLESLDPAAMKRIVPAVLFLLDALREADVQKWIADLGAPTVTWQEQLLSVDEENDRVFGWHDKMAASHVGLEPYLKGLDCLKANIQACPNQLFLQHNDLLHNNVLAANDKIAAVFDWGCAGLGDFLYELAMFSFYKPWFPAMRENDWVAEAKRHYKEVNQEVPDFESRLRCYEIHLGLSGMAYSAFKENWSELEANATRTLLRLNG